MPTRPVKLVVQALTKRYGDTVVLQPTDLAVHAGEFLTLLGPSGSGKTTLLQMICGLVQPSGGRVVIDGQDETDTPVHKRDIGLVFQHYALFPHLTVEENVGFPLRMRGIPPAALRERVASALAMVQLDQLSARLPRELSGGQQQRVALARCFVYKPSIILMDEPLGALDKKLREHLQIEIKRLHRQTGATIVYVTHDQEEALALSDRICLMNEARIEQIGTPPEIYANPKTAFAADFIGASNIFRGQASTATDGSPVLVAKDHRFSLPTHGFAPGANVALVVRPEQLSIGGSGENALQGTMLDSVYAGADTQVIVDAGCDAAVIVRLSRGQTPPPRGAKVVLRWTASDSVVIAI